MALHLSFSLLPFSKKPPLLSSSSSPPRLHHQRITTNFHPIRCLQIAAQISSSPPRRTAYYQPTIWNDDYIQSLPIDFMDEKYVYERNKLKEKVKHLIGHQQSLVEQLEFVDALCQLGLDYHFNSEIKNFLSSISFSMEHINNLVENNNLHGFALLFRLLRQHDVNNASKLRLDALLRCFKKKIESFNPIHQLDVKGVLSLYEASYLAREGEEELDEAGKIAIEHLRSLERSLLTPQLVEEIDHALELPVHWRMSRLHTRWFIEAYGRRENYNPTLLHLAKLSFNIAQSIHKTELQEISSWWRNCGLICEELNFIRDRLVENYLWSIGFNCQPEFGRSRKAIAKINCLVTTIDDIYDVYGTLDELKLFTNAIKEWKIDVGEQLPNYMKICLTALFNTMNDIATSFSMEKGLDILPFLKQMWANLSKAYLVEAKWYHSGHIPTLNEYLDNAWVSIAGICVLTTTYCLSDDLTIEALKSFEFYPPIFRHSCMLFRLYDDLGTSTAEIKRGDVPKSIQCYMKEKNVSEPIARDYIRCLIKKYWKTLNQEHTIVSKFMELFKKPLLDMPRTAQCFYQYRDGHAESDYETRDHINSIIIEPIPL
uniref:Terpenoid synthase n=1 Tax=Oncidium hybrid cultivar TaxID=141207 RepID=A0A6G8QTM4_ONCHC|nr:terpenoid synthase [Oncidium hybrid cultivar]